MMLQLQLVVPDPQRVIYSGHRADGTGSSQGKKCREIKTILLKEAKKIHNEEADATIALSKNGNELIKDGMTILTHCNTGPLATTGYGTALGIIIYAHLQGKKIQVYADETRPFCRARA